MSYIAGLTELTINSTNDIQSAINVVSGAGGGIVNLLTGTYNVASNITVPSNVSLIGEGSVNSIIDFGNGAYQIQIVGSNTYTTGTATATRNSTTVTGIGTSWTSGMVGRSILLEDFWYVISAVPSGTSITLSSAYTGNTRTSKWYAIATQIEAAQITGITVQNSSVALLKIAYTDSVNITGSFFSGGLIGIDADYNAIMGILSCAANSCGTGITLDYSNLGTYFNSNINNSTSGGGLIVNNCRNWGAEINAFENNTGPSCQFQNASNWGFNNFSIENTTGIGLSFVDGITDFSIDSGLVNNSTSDGIKFAGTCTGFQMDTTSFEGNGGYGINLSASSVASTTISSCYANNNTSGNINNQGVSTRVIASPGISDIPGFSQTLFDHYADVSNSGTSETILYTDTLAAARLANNGEKIQAEYSGTFSGAASATQQLRLYFGTSGGETLIFDSGALAIGVASPSWDIYAWGIRESSTIVRWSVMVTTSSAALSATSQYTKVTGLTLANVQVIKITGTAAGVAGGSNQITASAGTVSFVPTTS